MRKRYVWVNNVLTPEECEEGIAICSPAVVPAMYDKRNKQGELVMPLIPSLIRKTQVAWVPQGSNIDHLMQRMVKMVLKQARDFFYLPCSFVETIQFAKYGFLGHYRKHTDSTGTGRASRRLISASVQLSNPDDYKGGNLKVDTGYRKYKSHMHQTPREQGTLTVFPSVFEHKVTPVLRGQRCALVLWAHIEEPPSQEEIANELKEDIKQRGTDLENT